MIDGGERSHVVPQQPLNEQGAHCRRVMYKAAAQLLLVQSIFNPSGYRTNGSVTFHLSFTTVLILMNLERSLCTFRALNKDEKYTIWSTFPAPRFKTYSAALIQLKDRSPAQATKADKVKNFNGAVALIQDRSMDSFSLCIVQLQSAKTILSGRSIRELVLSGDSHFDSDTTLDPKLNFVYSDKVSE